ncbi:MAG: hypothetical protein L0G23_09765 [Ruaniaceae bacterium]|nr:hypothetical protein [Ruaniaceae bacterium]
MNGLIAAMLRMSSEMSRGLTIVSALFTAIFLGIALGSALTNGLFISWFLFAVALLLAVLVATFAWRRWRLGAHLTASENQVYVSSGTVSADAEDPADTFFEALYVETQARDSRFLPGVEATQRAMLQAAGGPVNAPYLKADLRITMVAFAGTLAAIPLSFSGAFLALLIWLLA